MPRRYAISECDLNQLYISEVKNKSPLHILGKTTTTTTTTIIPKQKKLKQEESVLVISPATQ